jgi:hypothetical protein
MVDSINHGNMANMLSIQLARLKIIGLLIYPKPMRPTIGIILAVHKITFNRVLVGRSISAQGRRTRFETQREWAAWAWL